MSAGNYYQTPCVVCGGRIHFRVCIEVTGAFCAPCIGSRRALAYAHGKGMGASL